MASVVPNLRNISINRTCSKTIHLLVEMNNHIIEGLVDNGASMSIIIICVLRELGIMHLVVGSKSYKTTSRVVIHTMGRINDLPIHVGEVIYAKWTSWLLTLMGMMCYLDYILGSFLSKNNSKSNDQQSYLI